MSARRTAVMFGCMSVIFDPHRDRREPLQALARNAGLLFGLMGWATIALGLASSSVPVFLSIPGGIATLMQQRYFRATGAMEVVMLAFLATVSPPSAQEWIWVGAATSGFGRFISMFFEAKAKIDGD